MAVSWSVLIFVAAGARPRADLPGGLVVGRDADGFCVQHDANHGAYFRHAALQPPVGWSADALLGFSSYAWRVKHNVAHHTYTNVDGYDDDISQVPFARLLPVAGAEAVVPAAALLHLAHVQPDGAALAVGRRRRCARCAAGSARARCARRAAGISPDSSSGKLIFIGWAIVIPLFVYPWWVVARRVPGFAMVDEPRHGDDVPARALRRGGELRRPPRSSATSRGLGGARGRVDGRLLPAQPGADVDARRPELPDRAPPVPPPPPHALPADREIVRRNAPRHGVRYTCQPSLWKALCSHASHVREMGRRGVPAEIEMG